MKSYIILICILFHFALAHSQSFRESIICSDLIKKTNDSECIDNLIKNAGTELEIILKAK